MNSYYQSLIAEIQKKIDGKAYQEAYDLIHQEISLPYVPQDCLAILESYQQECLPHIRKEHTLGMDTILSWIYEDPSKQEQVIPFMKDLNLRQYTKEVQDLLNAELLDESKGELIEYLMEQKIDTPFKIEKNGLDITFIPSSILCEEIDPVAIEVRAYLDAWFSNDDPAFLNFCMTLLHQEILVRRPFDLNEEEALPIAKAIVRLVYAALMRDDELEDFTEKKDLTKVQDTILWIERRGEFK